MKDIADHILEFSNWLSSTKSSQVILDRVWAIPIVQCVHILAISVVVGAVLMTNLKILGLAGRSQTMYATVRRFIPWFWWALAIAAASGLVMIIAEPVRELVNPAFWTKMILLVISISSAIVFQVSVNRTMTHWESTAPRRALLPLLAAVSIAIWVAIIVLGRWIAYAQVESF